MVDSFESASSSPSVCGVSFRSEDSKEFDQLCVFCLLPFEEGLCVEV